ncbi:MAG: SocA family protein [Eubacterium sp.]|nr:SocA family protein [Eubacterium sp.]
MENVLNVAAYIANRYFSEYGQHIDEMKLHKLMYFAQRESFIQTDAPLFQAIFYGWKYGPVLKEIRSAYKDGSFSSISPCALDETALLIINKIFSNYAGKDSWSLSRLTHGELSWKSSRIGVLEQTNSDNPMDLEDIKKDAERIKSRRKMLTGLGLA